MLRRKPRSDSTEPAEILDPVPVSSAGAPKGRPTPKRRTKSAPPAPAPKTRKEAVAWQKEHAAKAKVAGQRKLTPAEYKLAVRNGEVLPRRDQGPVRQLARDYVDSRRMGSNYLLLLFPLMFIGYFYPPLQVMTLVLFALFAGEWMYSGYRIRKLAVERGEQSRESIVTLGMYAGGRAYFPRKWRRPLPRVEIGDQI